MRTQLLLCTLLFAFPAPSRAQSQTPDAPTGEQQPRQQTLGSVAGVVVDQTGAAVVGAQVRLTRQDQSPSQESVSGEGGQFSFANVTPGPFQLTITAGSLSTQVVSGILQPGEVHIVPQITMTLATQVTQVTVTLPPVELADIQIQDQVKQRVFGIIPNFYVSYVPHAVPLTPKQKFKLAWKSSIDPFAFVGAGALAGIEQAGDEFSGYGQGAEGYAKRYGASYGDLVIGTFLGSAVLPSLWKQDPRYFYKGTGTKRSRILYALTSPFFCKGDNGNWQANYSYVVGNLAAGGIASLYYPASKGSRVEKVFETAFIRFGENSLSAVFQEFIFRKLTPHLPPDSSAQHQ